MNNKSGPSTKNNGNYKANLIQELLLLRWFFHKLFHENTNYILRHIIFILFSFVATDKWKYIIN